MTVAHFVRRRKTRKAKVRNAAGFLHLLAACYLLLFLSCCFRTALVAHDGPRPVSQMQWPDEFCFLNRASEGRLPVRRRRQNRNDADSETVASADPCASYARYSSDL